VEARQRWRLTFGRVPAGEGETPSGRDYIALWEAALADSGLPVAMTDAGRFRFALAAPLPVRTSGRAELADLWLTERVPAWRVREALEGVLPAGHALVALEDVWPGAPALAGRVAAADYRISLRGPLDEGAIAAAADRLLAADRLDRERAKGGGVKSYDLRPLLISIATAVEAGEAGNEQVVVRVRTRIHPELGSGRPEEVVAALAEALGAPLEATETIRERLVLSDDLEGG
jgi:radical SAM-linked protein